MSIAPTADVLSSTRPINAFYGSTVSRFFEDPPDVVVGALTTRAALEFRGNEREQVQAWQGQVRLLRAALIETPNCDEWSVLLEYPLRRLGRRPDAVILCPGVIIVLEFKMGAVRHAAQYSEQVEDYALCIRDFHGAVDGALIVPIVCAENAPPVVGSAPLVTDGVSSVVLANKADLGYALRSAVSVSTKYSRQITWHRFDAGGYNPTPTIIEAARAVYAGHSVAEIGRTDSDGIALQSTSERLRHWVLEARQRKERVVCLVTGTPGAGKTLLGLNLVLADGAGRAAGEPAVMLTGNRPLVQVITGALLSDARARGASENAKRALNGALQTLIGYLKEHAPEGAPSPPEHVVVFDEAQRAWDEETGQKLLQRRRSEPELFLEILHRLPWACLVCLVGPGQEINRGEGGMPLWARALEREAHSGRPWRVVTSSTDVVSIENVEVDPALNLSAGLRAYRSKGYGEWVDALLAGQIGRAAALAYAMHQPPAFLTRELAVLKDWLRLRRRGARRPGIVMSSGAVRLVADGVPPPPMSNQLKQIENWFLRSLPDFRGSDSLEFPLSEFGCQGLELDYVGLCWGGDLIWAAGSSRWAPRRMRSPMWQVIHRAEKAQYRLNAYRVLLTRAREGVCIFIPQGAEDDRTRLRSEFDAVAETLAAAGCRSL